MCNTLKNQICSQWAAKFALVELRNFPECFHTILAARCVAQRREQVGSTIPSQLEWETV